MLVVINVEQMNRSADQWSLILQLVYHILVLLWLALILLEALIILLNLDTWLSLVQRVMGTSEVGCFAWDDV